MPLALDDGYTLTATTKAADASGDVLPVLTFKYRPALPDALYALNYANDRAASGVEQLDIAVKFLADHIVSWDATRGGVAAKLNPENLRKLPMPVLQDALKIVMRWAPAEQATAEGNLPAA